VGAAPDGSGISRMGFISDDQPVAQTLVDSLTMIIGQELTGRLAQRAFSEQDHPVQAGLLDRSGEPLCVGIQIRRPGRQLHGLHSTGGQRPQVLRREQRVAVVDQVLLPRQEAVPSLTETPGRLVHPDSIGLGCDASDRNAPIGPDD